MRRERFVRREDRRTSELEAPESKLFHVNRDSPTTQASVGNKSQITQLASPRSDETNTDRDSTRVEFQHGPNLNAGRINTDRETNTEAAGEPQSSGRKSIHRLRRNVGREPRARAGERTGIVEPFDSKLSKRQLVDVRTVEQATRRTLTDHQLPIVEPSPPNQTYPSEQLTRPA